MLTTFYYTYLRKEWLLKKSILLHYFYLNIKTINHFNKFILTRVEIKKKSGNKSFKVYEHRKKKKTTDIHKYNIK